MPDDAFVLSYPIGPGRIEIALRGVSTLSRDQAADLRELVAAWVKALTLPPQTTTAAEPPD
jgi:hypothetical protein